MDHVFREGLHEPPDRTFRLSAMALHELMMLAVLGPLLQVNMRAEVCPSIYMLDASPSGGGICHATLGETACEELWRHSEQRGYYTALQQGAGSVLRELGLEHAEVFGVDDAGIAQPPDPAAVSFDRPAPDLQSYDFDCIELFSGYGNWSQAHADAGLRVHPGFERSTKTVAYGDLMDDDTFRDLAFVADSGKVKEWHAGPPCWSYGTLRRPRLRSKGCPAGFDMTEPTTYERTILAVRTAFLLTLAILRGCYVSVEQPGSSVMFELHCFQVLQKLGCWITKFTFCSYGSAFMKPSKWLHNKPWLTALARKCSCPHRGRHFVVQGSFTRASVRQFDRRCRPGVEAVYGRWPKPGEAVSSFSASYPKPLMELMAKGSVLAHQGLWGTSAPCLLEDAETEGVRAWHDDPDWIQELCEGVPYKELFRYKFKKPGHINILECRVYKSWLKHCAKQPWLPRFGLTGQPFDNGGSGKGEK